MDYRIARLCRRSAEIQREQAGSDSTGVERRAGRPQWLVSAQFVASSAGFPYNLRVVVTASGAMVQRLARGPFKAEIRVRFPLALPMISCHDFPLIPCVETQKQSGVKLVFQARAWAGGTSMADLLRSNNPVLKEKAFAGPIVAGETMTVQGTVNKTGLLLFFVVVTAAWTWGLSHSNTPEAAYPWMIGGAIGGFIMALVTVFKK